MALIHRTVVPSGTWPPFTITHYVTTDGTEAWGTNSEENPSSFATALANATAGDVVQIGPGIYTGTNTNGRFAPAWTPSNSGTSGNPIVFVAKYRSGDDYEAGVTTELRSGSTTNGSGCPAYGTDGKDHVWWAGFYVDVANSAARSDTGPCVIHGSSGTPSVGCRVLAGRFKGVVSAWADNYSAVRCEHAQQWKVLDCKISGFYTSNYAAGFGVVWYACSDYEVAYNDVSDCYGGIYPKGANNGVYIGPPATIHHNYIHNFSTRGILIAGVNRSNGTDFTDVYQNLIVGDLVNDGRFGLSWVTYSDPAPLDVRVVNNTITVPYESGSYAKSPTDGNSYNGCVWQNNITFSSVYAFTGDADTDYNQFATIDYNTYYSNTNHMNGGVSFATWQSSYGHDTNGDVRDPVFENAGSGDYRLGDGSSEIDDGVDILNLLGGGTSGAINRGCYILGDQSDEIGPRSNPSY